MKNLLIAIAIFVSGSANAATCSYSLDQEPHDGIYDGDLVLNGQSYRCLTIYVGDSSRELCKKKGNRTKHYDLMVGFDGAENEFFVFPNLDADQEICHGVASEKGERK